MKWEEIYNSKLVTAEQAARKIKSGSRIVIGNAAGEPTQVIGEMVRNKERYKNIDIYHMLAMGKADYAKPGMNEHFRDCSFFLGSANRQAYNDGRGEYIPCFFSEIPRLFKEKYIPVDVAIIQVSPPDDHGFMSFGVSVDYTKPAAEAADIVIAEVNPNMPRTLGNSFIHVSDVDYIVEVDYPVTCLNPPVITDVERAIGKNCASLIKDGSTLQLGIGAIPDAVLSFLTDKHDLGIHSEMISDGIIDLVESGVINGSKKTIHKGKIVVTFLMGTERLYDFVNNNPQIEMHPVNYINNPVIIAQNHKMVSINSCLQVDLMGQIAADTIGYRQFSGVGGQIDFIRGATMSEGGVSIIATPSTAAGGRISKIVPILDEGAAVTTTRNEVHYVVTEYGIALLKGKSLKERARALINIAHPRFRDELIEEWEIRFRCPFYKEDEEEAI